MTQKFYVDAQGKYLGSYDGPAADNPFKNKTVVAEAPANVSQVWNGTAFVNPSSSDYMLSKATVWRRMTSAEAAAMDALMQETDAQIKQIYLAAQYLSTTDELWGMLKDMLTAAFSASRANELLAPE